MRFFENRSSDPIVPNQRRQSRQRFIKLLRISERCFKQTKLLRRRPARFRAKRDGNDWMFRFKILQMRLQHPEEKIDIVRRLRDFKNSLVSASRTGIGLFARESGFVSPVGRVRLVADLARIRESDRERELTHDEINAA